MGARKRSGRMGRPPLPPSEKRSRALLVKLTEDEHATFAAAAERLGTTLADEARAAWTRLAERAAKGARKR